MIYFSEKNVFVIIALFKNLIEMTTNQGLSKYEEYTVSIKATVKLDTVSTKKNTYLLKLVTIDTFNNIIFIICIYEFGTC